MMRSCPRHRRSLHHRRRGYTLVIFALIFFCLMALGALVIDLGIARMTQRQMQTAVDSAALEGLRFQDNCSQQFLDDNDFRTGLETAVGPIPESTQTATAADWIEWRKKARKYMASQQVATAFSDFQLASNQQPFGAGPIIPLSGGIGDDPSLTAGQLIGMPTVYKPTAELNLANEQFGDLVAGTYDPTQAHIEYSDYTRGNRDPNNRKEFVADESGAAFLARLRRTNDTQYDRDEGVSSAGPTLPFLFGRGSLIHKNYDDPNATYSPREDGITVRATAIGNSQRALSVGRRVIENSLVGMMPLAIDRTLWEAWESAVGNSAATITLNDDGTILINMSPNVVINEISSPVNDHLRLVNAAGQSSMAVIGDSVPATATAPAPSAAAFVTNSVPTTGVEIAYIPIYFSTGDSDVPFRMLGFGFSEINAPAGGSFSFTKQSNKIGPANASASLARPIEASADVSTVISQNRNFGDPLLAPALVR
jgi:hypothetical protein